ncbi:hypothetical protein B9Q03_00410 [Candidatus Marsarchaeota G2 archaeon OSP_D]|uniref:PIN domain-containing protein n=6 Tax=Candidatus Marsarchaeota group 2 TaxID=2203771 RepID=A0A2R6CEN1_9ARCH|nr:MAG: hypothetical protein B9Q08_03375 [Candidatus Marsarchaeota G2 archaeon ECH_B_SAG-M15]PSN92679.1 MAG: hypothetical protein B9Q03_00410 [Candidatus Marsarchaeota G2 archaeon OSP_D]PSN96777.1 MAG: hypothetical protein B9Q06_01170 [Candidatus Marsarchaeota G2 archaeon ECH_B_2]PSO01346.1 MAG: hypothetical protein B9Q07_00580 [Candidatus Marsarchaeota G2 archaeon ECH_B_3]PSO03478.1 MAG: hypothetical protein B9Q05_01170 [Candidatus Marsarchaeota G2 archaeon ECH_B_1]PSO09355.1 MAG: hypothetica
METYRLRHDKVPLILLDSSGLIHALSRRIDIISWFDILFASPYKIGITKAVLEELKKLSATGTGKTRLLAALSLKLCEKCTIIDTQTLIADDSLLEASLKHDGIVFTCDSGLRRRLSEQGVPAIIITNDNRLIFSP